MACSLRRRTRLFYFSAIPFLATLFIICNIPFGNFRISMIRFAFRFDYWMQGKRIQLISPFAINYEYAESANDISSDMEYDKALMFRFLPKNMISSFHLQQQKMYYNDSSQKERIFFLERERDTQWLVLFYIPQLSCPTQVRVGSVGENGYTVCNPWVLATAAHRCVIYSFGINNLVKFESSIYKVTDNKCNIFCFDEEHKKPELFRAFNGTFFKTTVSHQSFPEKRIYSLLDLSRRFGHNDRIDILKMDVDGAEFNSLGAFLRRYEGQICQIIVELHANGNWDTKIWLRFFRMMERRGYRFFNREANTYFPYRPWTWKYSYIHISCFEEYGISQDAVIFRYFG